MDFIVKIIKVVNLRVFTGFISLIVALLILDVQAKSLTLQLGVYDEHQEMLSVYLGENQRCPSIHVVDKVLNNELLLELAILCEALRLGGIEASLALKPYPLAARMLMDMKAGKLLMTGFAFWSRYEHEDLYRSAPILKANTYAKGLYSLSDHPLLQSTALGKPGDISGVLSRYVAVSNHTWDVDQEQLACLSVPSLSILGYEDMFHSLKESRADFMLLPFSVAPELRHQRYGLNLQPVAGVKVVFNDSRHFFVSQHHSDGADVLTALDLGLKRLIEDGTIERLYKNVGQFNPQVEHWQAVGCGR